MKSVLTLLKQKMVIGGIFMAVFYQIVFITIYMSGYGAMTDNLNKLSVAIVNEDEQYGKEIADSLAAQLPFKLITDANLANAQEELDNRDLHMIVHIPENFTEKLQAEGEQAPLDFFINQSNPAMVSSSMQQVATQLTATLNQQFAAQNAEKLFAAHNMPEEQAKALAAGIAAKLAAEVDLTNPIPAGMQNQVAPMFLSMVSVVGAMIFAMLGTGAAKSLVPTLGKWRAFGAFHGVSAIVSVFAPVVGLSIAFGFHGYGFETFFKMWGLHALEMFAAIEFMGIFFFLLGQAGMLVSLFFILVQSITSGVMMPQAVMPDFYRFLSYISVMFYSAQTDMSLMFGGGKAGEHILGLIIIAAAAILINAIIYWRKTAKTQEAAPAGVFATE
ncbi:YhgE/Pip domain-containing protein [Cohnella thailandensis]|uniref:DUF3533 domain-containing protein n=1 Tax=Cohnella thailandensis TaxID=557557 RepID=A0A841SW50_9BACL|nr:ABC transporter permease [Cohnella thailandensis]MBB6634325.1 DUF3533 domain-containing protein [Cohnella thailandensis]MBP1972176.1 YhgE/Pip-like protein [Cohnella thailandensis]